MGIDKNSLAPGLFEQFFKIFEIVTRYQDGFAFFMSQRDFCGYRMTLCLSIAGIQ